MVYISDLAKVNPGPARVCACALQATDAAYVVQDEATFGGAYGLGNGGVTQAYALGNDEEDYDVEL